MKLEAKLVVFALGCTLLLYVFNLVRTRKLKERFALLWVVLALICVIAPWCVDLVNWVAEQVHVDYPPALIFVVAFVVFLFIFFQFSVNISKLSDQIKDLTQELATLRSRIEAVEGGDAARPGRDAV